LTHTTEAFADTLIPTVPETVAPLAGAVICTTAPGVGVDVGVGVTLALGVEVGVGVTVAKGVDVGVTLAMGVEVGVGPSPPLETATVTEALPITPLEL
jgi:hypothetical protein